MGPTDHDTDQDKGTRTTPGDDPAKPPARLTGTQHRTGQLSMNRGLPRGICVPVPRLPVAIDLNLNEDGGAHAHSASGPTATAFLLARLDATNRAPAM